MSLFFYDVDTNYVKYLKEKETEARGFSRVPDIEYLNERKMVCGIVLKINGYNYYVPISSYKIQQPNNILIRLDDDTFNQVKGSLRFNYMFPIADKYITKRNFSLSNNIGRKEFLRRQWLYCNSIADEIEKTALKTYNDVIAGKNKKLVNASCDFKLLEKIANTYQKDESSPIF